MWKCSNACSLPILISRAAYPYFFDYYSTEYSTIRLSIFLETLENHFGFLKEIFLEILIPEGDAVSLP
jgi:hypothetical protein